MKKLICSLLIIIMTFGCVSALAVEEITVTEQTIAAEKCIGCYIQYVSEESVVVSEESTSSSSAVDNSEILLAQLAAEEESGFDEIELSDYYGYNLLLDEDKDLADAYIKLLQGATAEDKQIKVASKYLSEDEIKDIYFACHNDNPQLFHMFSGYAIAYSKFGLIYTGTYIEPIYSVSLNLNDHNEQFEKAAEEIIAASGVKPDMSDYDKAIMLYNELALRVTYDDEDLVKYDSEYNEACSITDNNDRNAAIEKVLSKYAFMHSAYSAMVNGTAVCDGYSRAYQYLLYKVGVNSHITTGIADGGGHAWNLIKLDGKWYYTDLTWGDDSINNTIFYEYFNMTDEQLADCNHIVTNSYALPECTSTELNYFTVNGGMMASDSMDVDNIVEQLKKNSYARIYLTDDPDFSVINAWYSSHVNEIVSRVADRCTSATLVGSGREYHLVLFHDTIAPMENVALEVSSTSDRECRFYAGFYDENGILIGIDEVSDLSLNANKIVTVKPTKIPDNFKKIKYFIWDKENGLKPIYNVATATY